VKHEPFSSPGVVASDDLERSWLRVESPDAARVLTDVNELRALEPFLARERTVKEASDVLGVPLDALYFRVRRFHRLGLLRVAAEEPRGGRALKRYTSSAKGFFFSYHIVPNVDFETLALSLDLPLERRLIHNLLAAGHDDSSTRDFGFRVFRDAHGHIAMDAAYAPEEPYDFLEPHNPAIYSMWPELDLDFADAKALQRELDALWRRYAGKRGAMRYQLRLGLAPLLEP
jgi:hypothetical protein